MNWKEFLKPNWEKMLAFSLLVITTVFCCSLIGFIYQYTTIIDSFYFICLYLLIAPLIIASYIGTHALLAVLPTLPIYWYLLSCVMVSICEKYKIKRIKKVFLIGIAIVVILFSSTIILHMLEERVPSFYIREPECRAMTIVWCNSCKLANNMTMDVWSEPGLNVSEELALCANYYNFSNWDKNTNCTASDAVGVCKNFIP